MLFTTLDSCDFPWKRLEVQLLRIMIISRTSKEIHMEAFDWERLTADSRGELTRSKKQKKDSSESFPTIRWQQFKNKPALWGCTSTAVNSTKHWEGSIGRKLKYCQEEEEVGIMQQTFSLVLKQMAYSELSYQITA